MPAGVMRCADGPAAVPSRVVKCETCGADCWLSLQTGESVLRVARELGDGRVLCMHCIVGKAAGGHADPEEKGE